MLKQTFDEMNKSLLYCLGVIALLVAFANAAIPQQNLERKNSNKGTGVHKAKVHRLVVKGNQLTAGRIFSKRRNFEC